MDVINMSQWEIDALKNNRKSCKRIELCPSPVKGDHGLWRWHDCQWSVDEPRIPQSLVNLFGPCQVGDNLRVRNQRTMLYEDFSVHVTYVWAERIQDMTEASAEKEGCQGMFSGTGEGMGSGWAVTPREEFATY